MILSPKLGLVEISTLWHFRLPLLIQKFIKVASSPRLSGIGMPSPILWSHLLKMQSIVLLRSLLWWELGTNSLITGPGEWLSFRRFTSKLSWSWWPATNMCSGKSGLATPSFYSSLKSWSGTRPKIARLTLLYWTLITVRILTELITKGSCTSWTDMVSEGVHCHGLKHLWIGTLKQ